MTFSWVLRKRSKLANDDRLHHNETARSPDAEEPGDDVTASLIHLRVEDGLLMAFGPLGDPVPPAVVKTVCATETSGTLKLPNGEAVDRRRLIDVLEAQQRGPLATHASDRWIEAMLGVKDQFEPTPDDLLAREIVSSGPPQRDRLHLGMACGNTMQIRDAHPGDVHTRSLARLMAGGKARSIRATLGNSSTNMQSGEASHGQPTLNDGSINLWNEAITLDLHRGQGDVRLETASPIWSGEPKVDLVSPDGEIVAVDELFTMLQASARQTENAEAACGRKAYPLLDGTQPLEDLERATIVMISGLPDGWTLTKGMENDQGSWIMEPAELLSTDVVIAGTHVTPASLEIKVISMMGVDGDLNVQTLNVVCPASLDSGHRRANPISRTPTADGLSSSTVCLTFDQAEKEAAKVADAILLRGLPAEMSLSAGAYDPSVKGWVLRPDQLDGLSIDHVERTSEAFEIQLIAVNVQGDRVTKMVARKKIDVIGQA